MAVAESKQPRSGSFVLGRAVIVRRNTGMFATLCFMLVNNRFVMYVRMPLYREW